MLSSSPLDPEVVGSIPSLMDFLFVFFFFNFLVTLTFFEWLGSPSSFDFGILAYLCEEVVEHFASPTGVSLGKMVGGADEEIVTHCVRDEFLVQVFVHDILPVGVLEAKVVHIR